MFKMGIVHLVFMLGVSGTTYAQQVLQETIDVSIHVIAKLAVVSATDVDMGTILSGTESVVRANSADASFVTNPGIGATAGEIVLSGASGQRVEVAYSMALLSNGSGTTVSFAPRVYHTSVWIYSGKEVTFSSGSGNSSQLSLDIGGMLDVIPNGSEGDYSTTKAGGSPITFTFTYTTI